MEDAFVKVATLDELRARPLLSRRVGHRVVLLVLTEMGVYALDNRCPHMGFPLHRGTIEDGLLTCHWHHARFDVCSGGTFDLWADDVPTFPVEVRDNEVWVNPTPRHDARQQAHNRLRRGLERNLDLLLAKGTIALSALSIPLVEAFRHGVRFGVRYRAAGWGPGLTMLTCFHNMHTLLDEGDRPLALYHGLAAVAEDCEGQPPRFTVEPLPGVPPDQATLKAWFRKFVEVRDAEGAERCVASAVAVGAPLHVLADMLFAAITDHRYVSVGHPLDFTNKALEALAAMAPEDVTPVLTSLVPGYARGVRMEEHSAWRAPVDLVAMLEAAFERLPALMTTPKQPEWDDVHTLTEVLLGDNPQAIVDGLLEALADGCPPAKLAQVVAYAAARRLIHFGTANQFTDWDTALHTWTFANAVHQGLKRFPSADLVRAVFDAAMSVYLDRFLNVPPAPLPTPDPVSDPRRALADLQEVFDQRDHVNEASTLVAAYLRAGGSRKCLQATLGRLLLCEDRDFHTIQAVEVAFRQAAEWGPRPEGDHCLIAAARYLAAHTPTSRAQHQTYTLALRLMRGERLDEVDEMGAP
ncbi:MAG: Rieske 2Fe-2S domain-containing protein [Ardenticatenia bacterium]|nr:Rieske 2Fe-2S domain-containing protein [Ardenticatenia bacterium]